MMALSSGLKGSMRVKGSVPSQRVHIGKAVHEGMRLMFKGAVESHPRAIPSESSRTAHEGAPSLGEELADISSASYISQEPRWEDRIKVTFEIQAHILASLKALCSFSRLLLLWKLLSTRQRSFLQSLW